MDPPPIIVQTTGVNKSVAFARGSTRRAALTLCSAPHLVIVIITSLLADYVLLLCVYHVVVLLSAPEICGGVGRGTNRLDFGAIPFSVLRQFLLLQWIFNEKAIVSSFSQMVTASDLRSVGHGFDSRSGRYQAT